MPTTTSSTAPGAMCKLIGLLLFATSATAQAQDLCRTIAGASVIAEDGAFLGRISSQYAADSIFNEYGTFGSQYSATSIWNQYSIYGGAYSVHSPFNAYASTPPKLAKNGRVIAYLTVNKYLAGAVDPNVLRTCTFY